jgi:uncharacterized membrane protein (DUF4010 family)
MIDSLILRLGFALAIGLIVGIERGWRERDAPAGSRTAGVRTYGLSGLLGGVFAALAQAVGAPLLLAFGFLGFAAVFAWFKVREAQADESFSVTGVVAALVVFGLGALAVSGDPKAAASAGVATAGLLALRDPLHGFLERLTWRELRSALLLTAMTVIVLPSLPNAAIDPWGGVNPREIWFFTVLTAGISYAGYVAVKVAGPARGVLLSAVAGAVVSSTAVTLAFARRAIAGEPASLLAAGASLAGLISVLRVVAIVVIVRPSLVPHFAVPALVGGAAFGAGALIPLCHPGEAKTSDPGVGKPFDLVSLLLFAGAFAGVALLSAWATQHFGSGSLYVTSGMFGIMDVDVATLTAARLAGAGIPLPVAARAILLAIAVNAVMRVVYAGVAGSVPYALRFATVTLAAFILGGFTVMATAM